MNFFLKNIFIKHSVVGINDNPIKIHTIRIEVFILFKAMTLNNINHIKLRKI